MEEFFELRAPATVHFGGPTPGQHDPESAYRVAFELLGRRAPDEALVVLEPALTEDPENTGLRMLRAWAYFIKVQLVRAEAELQALVEENPGDDWVRFALGRVLERQSKYAEAIGHLRLAAAMSGDPEHELAVLRVERLAGLLD